MYNYSLWVYQDDAIHNYYTLLTADCNYELTANA